MGLICVNFFKDMTSQEPRGRCYANFVGKIEPRDST